MNYEESSQILDKIKSANKILVNCHRNPDPDSAGGALSLYRVLKNMDKEVEVVCPTAVSENLSFLDGYGDIKTIDFEEFDFSPFDLFVCVDSASWGMVTGAEEIKQPDIEKVVIDHHKTNDKYGTINLLDWKVNSVAEVLYKVYEDWGVGIDKVIATSLLAGVIGDTGSFRFPGTTAETMRIAADLLEKGAESEKINLNIFFTVTRQFLMFWADLISRMEVDEEYRFAWTAAPLEVYEKYGRPNDARERIAGEIMQSVKGTDFGMVIVETEKSNVSISFRSRTGFDVSQIALALGGGGHEGASGARVEKLAFDQAVTKVLETARKYAKKGEDTR